MQKLVFKNPIVNTVVGAILIVFAIVALLLNWFDDIVDIVIAVLIVYYAVTHYVNSKKKYKNSQALMILTTQAVVIIIIAVFLVLKQFEVASLVSTSFALGMTLYLHGFVYLLILQLLKLRSKFVEFLIYMAILTLGTYVLFGNPPFEILKWLMFALIIAYGALLLIIGLEKIIKKK